MIFYDNNVIQIYNEIDMFSGKMTINQRQRYILKENDNELDTSLDDSP